MRFAGETDRAWRMAMVGDSCAGGTGMVVLFADVLDMAGMC